MSPATSRPERLVVVAGTGTEVGKTWVTCRLIEHLVVAGARVAARKPAQSFSPGDGPTDAELLGTCTGEPPTVVCPPWRWYPVPLAPPMAAERLGAGRFGLDDLVAEMEWPDPPATLGLIESAGGVRSPLAVDGDTVDLVARVRPDRVVVVADAGLGTINAVRLSVAALEDHQPVTVFLNHFHTGHDETARLHRDNADWLSQRVGLDVVHTAADLAAAVTAP